MIDPAVFATLAALAAPAAKAPASRSLLDYIAQGREVGLLIVLLSLVAVALIIAQLLSVRLGRLAPDAAVDRLTELLRARRVRDAIDYCRSGDPDCMLARTMGAALERCARSPFGFLEFRTAVEEIGKQEIERAGRLTEGIGLIAAIAPMLGLLGTVVGMVGAFDTLSITEGPVRPDALAGDISEALITTVLGLIVAIPATAMHTFLNNRLDHLAAEVSGIIEELGSHLETPAQATPQGQAPSPQPGQPQPSQQPARPAPSPQAPSQPPPPPAGVSGARA